VCLVLNATVVPNALMSHPIRRHGTPGYAL